MAGYIAAEVQAKKECTLGVDKRYLMEDGLEMNLDVYLLLNAGKIGSFLERLLGQLLLHWSTTREVAAD